MSYILDALRKADAERERDPARGIHAQPLATVPTEGRRPATLPWLVLAVVVAAGSIGAYAWRDAAQSAPLAVAPSASPLAARAAVPLTPVPTLPASNEVQPPAPAVRPLQVAATPVVRALASVPTALAPATPLAAAKVSPKPVASAEEAKPPKAAAVPPVATAAPAAAAAPERVFTVAELPNNLQQDLPKLAITGGVHSDNPSQRMLVVGGQVVNEGAELAPGLVLQEIRAKTAVLKFRGYRYSVTY
jgi:general secretion pathway protein B